MSLEIKRPRNGNGKKTKPRQICEFCVCTHGRACVREMWACLI